MVASPPETEERGGGGGGWKSREVVRVMRWWWLGFDLESFLGRGLRGFGVLRARACGDMYIDRDEAIVEFSLLFCDSQSPQFFCRASMERN